MKHNAADDATAVAVRATMFAGKLLFEDTLVVGSNSNGTIFNFEHGTASPIASRSSMLIPPACCFVYLIQ